MSDVDNTTVTKICKKCNEEKSITEFHKNKTAKDGYMGNCKDCRWSCEDKERRAASYKAWYDANIERIKISREANKDKKAARHKIWYAENKDRISSYNKEWSKRNKEKIAAHNKEYARGHREEYKAHCRNRRARLKDATGTHTAEDIQNLLILQRKKCAVCLTSIAKGYHVDHIVALVNGGSNDKLNLQLLCGHCNCTKSSKDPIDFMNENGRLL